MDQTECETDTLTDVFPGICNAVTFTSSTSVLLRHCLSSGIFEATYALSQTAVMRTCACLQTK